MLILKMQESGAQREGGEMTNGDHGCFRAVPGTVMYLLRNQRNVALFQRRTHRSLRQSGLYFKGVISSISGFLASDDESTDDDFQHQLTSRTTLSPCDLDTKIGITLGGRSC